MEIIYRAFDGMEFNNENDCMLYEHNMNTLPDAITFFDCNGEPHYASNADEVWHAYNLSKYMEIANIKSREDDVKFCKSFMGFVMPDDPKPGVYRYDEICDRWVYMDGATPADLPIKKKNKGARRFCKTESVMCPYNWKNFCYYEGVCDGDMEYIKNEENENED